MEEVANESLSKLKSARTDIQHILENNNIDIQLKKVECELGGWVGLTMVLVDNQTFEAIPLEESDEN